MSDSFVSVVVSTYQRAHLLPRLVRALEAQTLPHDRFEVVIADDGSTDETSRTLETIARQTTIELRTLRLDGNHGPAAGRNAAWRAARGAIVAFTDDDCVPTPQWLASGVESMNRSDVVVGRTIPDPVQLDNTGPFSRTIRSEDARFFRTCNIFYRRSDLEAAGGFDERLRTGEDTDLGLRIAEMERTVSLDPDAVAHHDVRPSSFLAAVREPFRWQDIPGVIAKHPQARGILYRRYFWRRSHPPVLLAVAGVGAAWPYPVALALTLPWLYLRGRRQPLASGRVARVALLPAAFVIDLLEVVAMLRGSIKHRALVL